MIPGSSTTNPRDEQEDPPNRLRANSRHSRSSAVSGVYQKPLGRLERAMGIEPTTRDGPAFRRRIVDAEISDVPLANPKATETFLLPHFGHCSFAASCQR